MANVKAKKMRRVYLFGGRDSQTTRVWARAFVHTVRNHKAGKFGGHEIWESMVGNEVIAVTIEVENEAKVNEILGALENAK